METGIYGHHGEVVLRVAELVVELELDHALTQLPVLVDLIVKGILSTRKTVIHNLAVRRHTFI